MKRNLFFLLTTLFFISCQDEPIWFDSKYVFLEQHMSEYSEFLKGNMSALLFFDFPTYDYNQNSKTLTYYGNLDMTKRTMMLLGTGVSAYGVASSGAATGLDEVHELPHEKYDLVVTRLDDDGTVYFTYKDSAMVLFPNEEWSKTWT